MIPEEPLLPPLQPAEALPPPQPVGALPQPEPVGALPPPQSVGALPPPQPVGALPPPQPVEALPPPETRYPARPTELPEPTYWPFFMAVGFAFIGWGLISTYLISIGGAIVFVIALIGWINILRHE